MRENLGVSLVVRQGPTPFGSKKKRQISTDFEYRRGCEYDRGERNQILLLFRWVDASSSINGCLPRRRKKLMDARMLPRAPSSTISERRRFYRSKYMKNSYGCGRRRKASYSFFFSSIQLSRKSLVKTSPLSRNS